MLSAPSNRAEQLIYQRRAHEQKLSNMQTKLKQEFHQQEFAKWQNKGKNIEINNQVRQKLASIRQQASQALNSRRQKLASLLEEEDKQYREQIIAMQETPEQTRQRMARRVAELKEDREKRRVEEVNFKLEKRFEQNADELRKVDQDLKELKVAYERNIQMVERQNQLQNQYEEEILFAELNKRDIRKKEEADRIKRQQQQEKVDQRNAILAIQKQIKKNKDDEEKVLTEKEKEMLREEWERQSELSKLKEKQIIEKQKEVTKVILEENQKIKRVKEEQIRSQKQADREMIQRIVLKERQLAEYEKLMKQKERDESKKSLQGFRNKNHELMAYEKELDRLIEAERVKRERKQQQQWEKKEKARVNLLYQVFDDRERKVRQHKAEREEDLRVKEQDKVQVERRINEYEQEQDRRKREEFEKNRTEQMKLLDEIALKEERRRLILLELQKEEREQQSANNEYKQKIDERKQQGREQLDQFKKTNRLF